MALCNRRKKQGGCQRVPYGPCLLSSTTVQTLVQCNDNSTRSYQNQSVHRAVGTRMQSCIKACQNCFKHCYNCETFKLLKSKVTLNICEKLKMTQRDTGNIKSKVNDSMRLVVVVKHVTF
jgi:hypothetical protein